MTHPKANGSRALYGRQAITTKYLGPTNMRGSRVKATCEAGSLTLDWDPAQNSADNHARAAQALAARLEWRGRFYMGALTDGYVFVQAEADTLAFFDPTLTEPLRAAK